MGGSFYLNVANAFYFLDIAALFVGFRLQQHAAVPKDFEGFGFSFAAFDQIVVCFEGAGIMQCLVFHCGF